MSVHDSDFTYLMSQIERDERAKAAPAPDPAHTDFWRRVQLDAAAQRQTAIRTADLCKEGALHDVVSQLARAYGTIVCLASRVERDEQTIAQLKKQKGG